jgi:hypothetical protein
VRATYDHTTFVATLPRPLCQLWHALEQLRFGEAPDYDALRALLAPAVPKLAPAPAASAAARKRGREAAAPAASVAGGPDDPAGKRLRAAMVQAILRREE